MAEIASSGKLGKLSVLQPPLPKELNSDAAQEWSNTVSGWLDNVYENISQITQSFNPLKVDHDLSQAGEPITWTAFPELIKRKGPDAQERWANADDTRGGRNPRRDRNGNEYWSEPGTQDEYSEWSVNRNGDRVTDVTFTSEGPEYWEHFIEHQPEDAIKVIEKMNNLTGVKLEELIDPKTGKYKKRNKYNTKTSGPIISLIHDSSTLGAEVQIVADATILRKHPDGTPVTDKDELIGCAQYGAAGRNSDPEIGFKVNGIARAGFQVQIKDPICIYIHKYNRGNFKLNVTGDEEDQDLKPVPAAWFEEQRGDFKKARGLRLKIHNATGARATGDGQNNRLLDLTDLWDSDGNAFVKYGAQFADHITIGTTGIVAPGKAGKVWNCGDLDAQESTANLNGVANSVISMVASAVGMSKANRTRH